MTTVAYRDGVIAGDSQVQTGNGIRCGSVCKVAKGEDVLGGAAGVLGEMYSFLKWIQNNCTDEQPEIKGNSEFVMVKDGIGHFINKDGALVPVECEFMAIGSGEEIALGAMAMGATAIEAVEIAIQFDTNSGGEIKALKL